MASSLTVSAVQQDPLARLARETWGSGPVGSVDHALVKRLYEEHLQPDRAASSQALSVLEVTGYLEQYLWPTFTPDTHVFEHIMSMVILMNAKHDAGTQAWKSAQAVKPEAVAGLIHAAAGLRWSHPAQFTTPAFTAVLHFLNCAFASLEVPAVRKPLLRLCSMPTWLSASPAAVASTLQSTPRLRRAWTSVQSKAAPADVQPRSQASHVPLQPPAKVARGSGSPDTQRQAPWGLDVASRGKWLETNLLPTLLGDLLATAEDPALESEEGVPAPQVAFLARGLELLADLLAQPPTRHMFLTVLQDAHSVLRLRRSAALRASNGRILRQLTDMLEFQVTFEVAHHGSTPVSPAASRAAQYARLQLLQRLLYRFLPSTCEDTALAAVGTLATSPALGKALSSLDTPTLLRIAQWLHLLPHGATVDEGADADAGQGPAVSVGGSKRSREDAEDQETAAPSPLCPKKLSRDFIMSVLLQHHAPHASATSEMNALPLYPTERLLWDDNLVPFGRYAPGRMLALPKLNLQFLTLSDYLLRSFNLYRLEAAYELRADLSDAVARMQPKVTTTYDEGGFARSSTTFGGWSRMALPLKRGDFSIVDVKAPRAGEVAPAEVRGEVTLNLASRNARMKEEWDEIREHDVVFMLTIRAEHADVEQAEAVAAASRARAGDTSDPSAPAPKRRVQPEDDAGLPWRLGITYVRAAEVVKVVDEDGNIMNDPVEAARRREAGQPEGPRGTHRTFTLALDGNQYHLDMSAVHDAKDAKGKAKRTGGMGEVTVRSAALVGVGGSHLSHDAPWPGQTKGEDVYDTFNLLVRRRGKENNFKAVLEAIRDVMNACTAEANAQQAAAQGDASAGSSAFTLMSTAGAVSAAGGAAAAGAAALPPWLRGVLLGYGDPAAAHPSRLPPSAQVMDELDWSDTFLDGAHAVASFPSCEVALQVAEPASTDADAVLALQEDDPASTSSAWDPSKWTMKAVPLDQASTLRPPFRVKRVAGVVGAPTSVVITAYPPPTPGPFPADTPPANNVPFTPTQVSAIDQGMSHGLTLIVGPPGTGKTDTAVQIISNLYHNFPSQKILLVTHSNQALNDLFAKLTARNIAHRHMLRLGAGSRDLADTVQGADFSKWGRVESTLARRSQLLAMVGHLGTTLGVPGAVGYTAETAGHFYLNHVLARIEAFQVEARAAVAGGTPSGAWVAEHFPFATYFSSAPGGLQGLFPEGQSFAAAMRAARSCFRHLRGVFDEVADYRPFELLRTQRLRTDFMLTKQARIVAMTCTHAALTRRRLIDLGFKYDSVVMEEAAQVLEVETLLPFVCQRQDMGEAHRLKRVVLIGDHKQLPPVVQSMALGQWSGLEQSMFTRLVRLEVPATTLNAQGRARPDMAALFNWQYGGLQNLPRVCSGPAYSTANAGFARTHQFVEVTDFNGVGESVPSPHFFQNLGEAEYMVATFMYMRILGYPAERISMLTTYNGQKHLLRDVVAARCAPYPWLGTPAHITTVDRFQGQQNDYVLLSLVRTRHVGHIRDVRRLVVAMSRARLGLYVFGRLQLFKDCFDISHVFSALAQHGTHLQLVPGETWPTQRLAVDVPEPFQVADVTSMGQLVHQMNSATEATLAAQAAAQHEPSAVPGSIPVEADEAPAQGQTSEPGQSQAEAAGGASVEGAEAAGGGASEEGAEAAGGASVEGAEAAGGASEEGAEAAGGGASEEGAEAAGGGASEQGAEAAGGASEQGAEAAGGASEEGAEAAGGASEEGAEAAGGGASVEGAEAAGGASEEGAEAAGGASEQGAEAAGGASEEGAEAAGGASEEGAEAAGGASEEGAEAAGGGASVEGAEAAGGGASEEGAEAAGGASEEGAEAAGGASEQGAEAAVEAAFSDSKAGMRLKAVELRELCGAAGLSKSGKKADMVARLLETWGKA